MLLRLAASALLMAAVLSHANPSTSLATPLYGLDVNGANPGNLLLVDQISGATSPVAPDVFIGSGSWNGLTELPSNDQFLYAVNNPRPAVFEDPQMSRLARINVNDGTSTLFPVFDPATIGVPEIFSTGIAISPTNPTMAVATGFENRGGFKRLIWKVNLATGSVVDTAVELEDGILLQALTYGLDGTTLYAVNDEEQLIVVDPDTGDVNIVGDTGLISPTTGLAFRPEDGMLFAIEAGFIDRLVTLDPTTGALLATVGSLGTGGPEGLAFVPCIDDVPGDTNHDCVVNVDDLNNVRNNFGATGMPVLGDTNGDGMVDIDDLNAVRNNFGAAAAVPEPSSALLALCAATFLFGRRRALGGRSPRSSTRGC